MKRTPLKRRSTKQARRDRQYRVLRGHWLGEHPNCEACAREATDVHHMAGRLGYRLLDVATWMATCPECHRWIHEHPAEARELGWLKKK